MGVGRDPQLIGNLCLGLLPQGDCKDGIILRLESVGLPLPLDCWVDSREPRHVELIHLEYGANFYHPEYNKC